MSKGRKAPDVESQPLNHAAAFRDRLGRAAWEAADDAAAPWEQIPEFKRDRFRRIGIAVFEAITIQRRGIRGTFEIGSGYAHGRREPYVEIAVDLSPAQFSPAKARELAMLLLECADAAESDAALWQFAQETLDLDDRQSASLIAQFRKLRDARRGGKVSAA